MFNVFNLLGQYDFGVVNVDPFALFLVFDIFLAVSPGDPRLVKRVQESCLIALGQTGMSEKKTLRP